MTPAELDLVQDVMAAPEVIVGRSINVRGRGPLTLDEWRTKPYVAEPLRTVDCSLMNDGAIALTAANTAFRTATAIARRSGASPPAVFHCPAARFPAGASSNGA